MRRTNEMDGETHALLVALELHRLQSIRNILLVILLIQLVLVGIGTTLIWRTNVLIPVQTGISPDASAAGGDNLGIRPEEPPPGPKNQRAKVLFSTAELTLS